MRLWLCIAACVLVGTATSIGLVWLPLIHHGRSAIPAAGWSPPAPQVASATSPDGRPFIATFYTRKLSESWTLDHEVVPLPRPGMPEYTEPTLPTTHPPAWTQYPGPDASTGITTTRWGIPFRCLESGESRTLATFPGGRRTRSTPTNGWWAVKPSPARFGAYVPTKVLWPGMIANVTLFALPMAAIAFGLPALVRFRRARGNRCAACNYDRRGLAPSAPCPECGHLRLPAN